jgi:hypothetical protein
MIYIAHRGLLNGPSQWENAPWAIEEAITVCGNAEIDLWEIDGFFKLGHDEPKYDVSWKWLREHSNGLWIHCKNFQALETLTGFYSQWNFFWHEKDAATLTSKGYIWAYPGKQPILNSIAVLPELYDDDISKCLGICSDYVLKYRGDL